MLPKFYVFLADGDKTNNKDYWRHFWELQHSQTQANHGTASLQMNLHQVCVTQSSDTSTSTTHNTFHSTDIPSKYGFNPFKLQNPNTN